jgi:hypothetical protein
MPSLKRIISAALFCLLMVFCVASAKADTTYTYTGQRLTDVEEVGCDPTPCIITGTNFSIDGSISVASPLAPNLNDAVVNFTSFAFSSEGLTDTSADEEHLLAEPGGGPFPLPGLFNVSTNAAGQIIKWDISLVGTDLGPPFLSLATGFGLFDCPNPHFCNPIADGDSVDNGSNETRASNQGHPGTWSISTGATVPEPASGTLLIAGLFGLAFALKKSF